MITNVGLVDAINIESDLMKANDRVITYTSKTIKATYNKVVYRIAIPVDVSACFDDAPKRRIEHAVVDTGATSSVISEAFARTMGLHPIDKGVLRTASGQQETNYYIIDVYLSNEVIIRNLRVASAMFPNRDEAFIIGMDIISKGCLTIDNSNDTTEFQFKIN